MASSADTRPGAGRRRSTSPLSRRGSPDLRWRPAFSPGQRRGRARSAEITGGFALIGSNQLRGGIRRVGAARTAPTTCSDSIQRSNTAMDRYVKLEVRVKRPGLQVRSTAGYVSPRGKHLQRSGSPRRSWRPPGMPSGAQSSRAACRCACPPRPFKGQDKKATVAITLEIAADKLNLVEEDGAHRGDARDSLRRHRREEEAMAAHGGIAGGLALKPETYERVNRSAMRVDLAAEAARGELSGSRIGGRRRLGRKRRL